jgi:hypothetical protein
MALAMHRQCTPWQLKQLKGEREGILAVEAQNVGLAR